MIKNIVRNIFGLVSIAACISITSVVINKPQVSAVTDCRKAVVLYARGSGQAENADEKQKLQLELNRSLGTDNYYFVELGKNMPGLDGQYPAVSLNMLASPGLNAIDAEFPFFSNSKHLSWLSLGSYNDSVNSGTKLVLEIIKKSPLISECPETRLVLSGYSQGAQVIGNALNDSKIKAYLNKIAYVALFGDPKLNHGSSTGKLAGGYDIPTPWLRGNINHKIGGGILDGRATYVPSEFEVFRVGSWCYALDGICSGNIMHLASSFFGGSLHGYYGTLYIPEAADEIATVLYRDTGVLGAATEACGAPKQDVVVNIDANDLMRSDQTVFSESGGKYLADNLLSSSCNTRVAITVYNQSDNPETRLIQNFTTSRQEIINSLQPLYQDSQVAVAPRSPIRESIISAMNTVEWRADAQKAVLNITNSIGTGWNSSIAWWQARNELKEQPLTKSVIQKSREKGGVQIFTTFLSPYMQGGTGDETLQYTPAYSLALTQPTAGSQLDTGYSPYSGLQNVVLYGLKQSFTNQPKVTVNKIRGYVGKQLEIAAIDTSKSVIKDALKTNHSVDYAWYLDCDNPQLQNAPNSPVITFTPTKAGKCKAGVNTYIAYNYCNYCVDPSVQFLKSNNVFEIEILPANYQEPPAPPVVTNIKRILQDGKLTVTWDSEGNDTSMFIIRDQNGEVIGITQEKQITFTDLPEGELPDISISNSAEDTTSEPVFIKDSPITTIYTPQPAVAVHVNEPQNVVAEFSYANQSQEEAVMGVIDKQFSPTIDINTNLSRAADVLKDKIQTASSAVWLWLFCIGITVAVSILIFFYERRKREV